MSKFNNDWYNPGSAFKRGVWYIFNAMVLTNRYNPSGACRKMVLRWFGARIGKGVVIKPKVNVKYPWNLEVGDYSWIGEEVWIDNLGKVKIGANVCISQGALLLCGNHDYKKATFDLIVGDITLEDGVWIGAKSTVTGGVTCASHAVLSAGSVASADLDAYTIYRGNPAEVIRQRNMQV